MPLMKTLRWILCAWGVFALSPRADAQVMYAATSAGVAGELYTLNPATGGMLLDIGPLNDAGAVNYPITGLAFNPVTGLLYGSTGNSVAATAAKLVSINPATARVTVIGSYNAGPVNGSGTPSTMSDLAFNASGQLFGVGSIGGPNVYAIDVLTGAATLVGSNGPLTSTTGGGLTISPAGVVYGTPTTSRFGTYNSTTGAYTNIGTPSFFPAGAGSYSALAFDGTGTLFGLNTGPTPAGGVAPTHIVTIDPATATVTDIGPSVDSLDAIAFAPAAVPEPGTLALLVGPVAVGLIKAARRRKLTAN
jgi:hypothetical protein